MRPAGRLFRQPTMQASKQACIVQLVSQRQASRVGKGKKANKQAMQAGGRQGEKRKMQ